MLCNKVDSFASGSIGGIIRVSGVLGLDVRGIQPARYTPQNCDQGLLLIDPTDQFDHPSTRFTQSGRV